MVVKGDVTRDDSQRRFLAQHSVAMLEQCCNYSKQCRNNIATLCCAKKSRCESSRVTSPYECRPDDDRIVSHDAFFQKHHAISQSWQ